MMHVGPKAPGEQGEESSLSLTPIPSTSHSPMASGVQLPPDIWLRLQQSPNGALLFEQNSQIIEIRVAQKKQKTAQDNSIPRNKEDVGATRRLRALNTMGPIDPSSLVSSTSIPVIKPPGEPSVSASWSTELEAAKAEMPPETANNPSPELLPKISDVSLGMESWPSELDLSHKKLSEFIKSTSGTAQPPAKKPAPSKPPVPPPFQQSPSAGPPVLELMDIDASGGFQRMQSGNHIVKSKSSAGYFPSSPSLNSAESWAPPWIGPYRLLRTSDTMPALNMLFQRLAIPAEANAQTQSLTEHHLDLIRVARSERIPELLSVPVPLCDSSDTSPAYRLLGRNTNKRFVLFFQSKNKFHTRLLGPDHEFQVALLEGENLLNDRELEILFKNGARSATPEEAKQSAKELGEQLRSGSLKAANVTTRPPSPPVILNPAALPTNNRGLARAIQVEARLLKRFEFNRTHNDQHLWDENLLPGISVFRNSLATLFVAQEPLIEGVLICIIAQKKYMIFDRRSKSYEALDPNANQRLWLRKQEP